MQCPICRNEFQAESEVHVRKTPDLTFRFRNGVSVADTGLVCCSLECAQIAVVGGRLALERLFAGEELD